MPVTCHEIAKTRSRTKGQNPSLRRQYYVEGTDEDSIAQAALEAFAPPVLEGLIRQDVTIEEHEADETFVGTCSYGRLQRPQRGKKAFNFDTGGERVRVTQAIKQTGFAPAGKKAADHKGAILVDKEGRAQGTEIETASFAFTVTGIVPHGTMNEAYVRSLFEATGHVNDGDWTIVTDDGVNFRFEKREAKLIRVTGSKQTEEDWELKFDFLGLPTKKNFKVGEITITEKAGHDFLWIQYEEFKDEAAKPPSIALRPKFAYVAQVFDEFDFARLGLTAALL